MKLLTTIALVLVSVLSLACSSASSATPTGTATAPAAENPTLEPVALPTAPDTTTAPAETAAPVGPQQGVKGTATDLVNVRGGPGLDFAVKSQLKQGDTITIIGKSADGLWWQFDGGWVSQTYIKLDGDATSIPVGTPSP